MDERFCDIGGVGVEAMKLLCFEFHRCRISWRDIAFGREARVTSGRCARHCETASEAGQ
jgi:hypothetical protein